MSEAAAQASSFSVPFYLFLRVFFPIFALCSQKKNRTHHHSDALYMCREAARTPLKCGTVCVCCVYVSEWRTGNEKFVASVRTNARRYHTQSYIMDSSEWNLKRTKGRKEKAKSFSTGGKRRRGRRRRRATTTTKKKTHWDDDNTRSAHAKKLLHWKWNGMEWKEALLEWRESWV